VITIHFSEYLSTCVCGSVIPISWWLPMDHFVTCRTISHAHFDSV
jgi:hypothetical protein